MQLRIEVLTPVHIGTGETLSGLEYATDGSFKVAHLSRLFRRDPARAQEIAQRLSGASPAHLRTMTLEDVLRPAELADAGLWRYALPASPATLAALKGARGREHEVRLAAKRPDGLAYVAGSGIKGALRTALIFAWAAGGPDWARQFVGLRSHDADREVQRPLYGARQDPNHDVLRSLAVGDTNGVPPQTGLRLEQEQVLSAGIGADGTRRGTRDGFKSFLVFLEALCPGQVLAGTLKLSEPLLDSRRTQPLGWSERQRALSVRGLCAAANQLAAATCAWELEHFGKVSGVDCAGIIDFYRRLQEWVAAAPERIAYLCLGRGAGWHKLTAGMHVAKHVDRPAFARFRDMHGLASRGAFDRREFVFPKSRKVIAEGGRAVLPLGWVRLQFQERMMDQPVSGT